MGIACCPDFADKRGAWFENAFVATFPEVLFFGRFIDDVLAVIAAPSEERVLEIAAAFVYEGVELVWSVSEWNTPFLDLFVFIDPVTNQVEHKPFRKNLNHMERIPWTSNHPKDVKKGTFIGEMSRLATLCSKPAYYTEAIRDLGVTYIARGYPIDLINHWIKEHTSERWRSRLSTPVKSNDDVLVLKTKFNEAWAAFNVHEMGQRISGKWSEFLDGHSDTTDRLLRDPATYWQGIFRDSGLHSSDIAHGASPGESLVRGKTFVTGRGVTYFSRMLDVQRAGFTSAKWIISRKRTRNTYDMVNLWKRTVLSDLYIDRFTIHDVDGWET
jgi:hypothetical protein